MKTRPVSVISSTTKGKNERIEFAATEKAKVCTSVRRRYLTVETTIPWERPPRGLCGRFDAVSGRSGAVTVVGSGTVVCLILSKALLAGLGRVEKPMSRAFGPVVSYTP